MQLRLRTKLTLVMTGLVLLVAAVLSGVFAAQLLDQLLQATKTRADDLANQVFLQANHALLEAGQRGWRPASDAPQEIHDFVRHAFEINEGLRTQHFPLRRIETVRLARQAERIAAKNEKHATLGRYMLEMKHSVNNALTSMLGNAELLLLEPGELSSQSLAQIKTIHSMALRINEVMQRFSSLASEMQEAENASQAETEEASSPIAPRR